MAKKQNKDALIQTRVPKKLADYALKAAERDGISVAAWLRRLVMDQQRIEEQRLAAGLRP